MIPGIFDRCDNCKRLLLMPIFTGEGIRRMKCNVKEHHDCVLEKINTRIICSECKRNHR